MNTSQLRLFFEKPLISLQTASVRFLRNRSLILAMSALQFVWLVLIAVTGASTRYDTLLAVAVISLLATLLVLFLPTHAIEKIYELKDWLFRSEKRSILFLCIVGLLAGAFYASIQNPGDDEMSSLNAARLILSDGIPLAYHRIGWLGQQHPPLFPLIYSLAVSLPGPDLFFMRLVSVIFLAGTLAVTYLLGRELYSREVGYLAALLLLSFPLVIRLSATAMMDIQLAFFFGLALLMLIRLSKNPSYGLAVAIGLVIGIGLLTKYIMVFIFVVLFFYFLCFSSFRKITMHLIVVGIVSMSVFAVWLVYANQMGVLSRQFQKIINFMGTYHMVVNIEESIQETPPAPTTIEEAATTDPRRRLQNGIFRLGLETLFTRLPSALGVYHAPLILLGLLYLLKRRRPVDWMLLLWIGSISIFLFLTLPDHRYFLSVFPALGIVVASTLLRFPDYAERAVLLSLLLGAGNLFMFANWVRESHIFLLGH